MDELPAGEPSAADEPPAEPAKKKTRRGSRGGRGRKRPGATATANGQPETPLPALPAPTIHVPDADLGEPNGSATRDGDEQAAAPRKKTRRGSRGGRRRRKPAGTGAATETPPSDES